MDDHPNITNRLKVLRAERNITQENLAQAIKVTRVTISCIERAEYNPSLGLAFKLARFFEVRIEDIFQFKGDLS